MAITFDDGYVDNLTTASPILTSLNLPATFFVTTGHTGRAQEFWWDELHRVLLQAGKGLRSPEGTSDITGTFPKGWSARYSGVRCSPPSRSRCFGTDS